MHSVLDALGDLSKVDKVLYNMPHLGSGSNYLVVDDGKLEVVNDEVPPVHIIVGKVADKNLHLHMTEEEMYLARINRMLAAGSPEEGGFADVLVRYRKDDKTIPYILPLKEVLGQIRYGPDAYFILEGQLKQIRENGYASTLKFEGIGTPDRGEIIPESCTAMPTKDLTMERLDQMEVDDSDPFPEDLESTFESQLAKSSKKFRY
jgi:hypothetical protein